MKKITISALALGAILIAVGFAVQPIQQATAVHTTIQANTNSYYTLTGTVGPDADAGVLEAARWTISQPFSVVGVTGKYTVNAVACDIAAANIRTDLVPEAAVTEPNPAASNAVDDVVNLLANAVADSDVVGATVLEVGTVEEGATCAAGDRMVITAIIDAKGSLTTAPTATIATVSGAKANGLAGD